jgi:hypothetical protein
MRSILGERQNDTGNAIHHRLYRVFVRDNWRIVAYTNAVLRNRAAEARAQNRTAEQLEIRFLCVTNESPVPQQNRASPMCHNTSGRTADAQKHTPENMC